MADGFVKSLAGCAEAARLRSGVRVNIYASIYACVKALFMMKDTRKNALIE